MNDNEWAIGGIWVVLALAILLTIGLDGLLLFLSGTAGGLSLAAVWPGLVRWHR